MRDKSISVADAFSTICDRISDNTYTSPVQAIRDTDTLCCSTCATSIFQALVFDYRLDISKSELPAWAATRPDCWYVKNEFFVALKNLTNLTIAPQVWTRM